MEYSERLAAAVRPALHAGERFVAAVPADRAERDRSDVGHWSTRSRHHPTAAGVTVREHAEAAPFPVSGRMALVLTDRRLRVYRRRRFRTAPSRHLLDVPIERLGNVEGTYQPAAGASEFELMLIMSDGTACPLRVPSTHAEHGREFVRRAQGLLRN